MMDYPKIEDLIGKTFKSVRVGNDELIFENAEGKYVFYHEQSCCESVYIDDIEGELSDLENSPITMADESWNAGDGDGDYDSCSYTWTFYKFATFKGFVDVKWYGTSNGYYSESVDLKYETNRS